MTPLEALMVSVRANARLTDRIRSRRNSGLDRLINKFSCVPVFVPSSWAD